RGLTREEQADLAALDLAHHLIAGDNQVRREQPIVLLVRQLHLRPIDLGEHADAAQALLPDFPGNRLGGHGIVEDHAPVAGIALLDDLQDEVLLSWGIEESIADPRADPLAGDVGTVDGGRSGRRWIHRRGHRRGGGRRRTGRRRRHRRGGGGRPRRGRRGGYRGGSRGPPPPRGPSAVRSGRR